MVQPIPFSVNNVDEDGTSGGSSKSKCYCCQHPHDSKEEDWTGYENKKLLNSSLSSIISLRQADKNPSFCRNPLERGDHSVSHSRSNIITLSRHDQTSYSTLLKLGKRNSKYDKCEFAVKNCEKCLGHWLNRSYHHYQEADGIESISLLSNKCHSPVTEIDWETGDKFLELSNNDVTTSGGVSLCEESLSSSNASGNYFGEFETFVVVSKEGRSSRGQEGHKTMGGNSTCRKRVGLSGTSIMWLMFASFFFLSLLSAANSVSIFDDDDDDEFGGVSSFTHTVYPTRLRRSAESFSSLNDALSLIPSNYSIHEPPPTNNSEATQVDFSVLIMNVRDIKELNEGYGDLELSLEMNLRIYWKDTRLSHLADRSGNKFIVLNPVLLDKIWHPDIFIDHVKGVAQPSLISKPASLRVYPDSSVRYSARITVTMACQMDFHYYPADTQRCNVDMKSYAYSSKILALDWREGKGALLVEYLELPNFDVALDTTQNFMVNTSSGSYSGIRFTILLRRKLSYHLIQTYLPSTLFIIVSWLSFLVPPESVPGRMALCMTTLLTLTAMFSAVRQNTPNVSYVKALDIWMVVCIIFVFLTLVEYTVLLKLKSKKPKPRPASPQTELPTAPAQQPVSRWTIPTFQYTTDASSFKFRGCKNSDGVINDNGSTGDMRHRENGESGGAPNDNGNGTDNGNVHPSRLPTPQLPLPPPVPLGPGDKPLNKYELAAKKIERFTSAVIPTLFVIFNFIYWPWLIESADYYQHEKSTTIIKSM